MNTIFGNDSTHQFLQKPILNNFYDNALGNWSSYSYSDVNIHVGRSELTVTGTDNSNIIDSDDFIAAPFREYVFIRAKGGHDFIYADTIAHNSSMKAIIAYGGDGNDIYYASEAHDSFDGGNGIDTISYENARGFVRVNLHTGDIIDRYSASDRPYDDRVYNVEDVVASNYEDEVIGNPQDNFIDGLDGRDVLKGGAGNDTIFGGGHDDTLEGGAGDDQLHGGLSDDKLLGGSGNDTLYGGHRNDTLSGDRGNDMLYGGTGDDGLYGGAGNDTLVGESGNNVLGGGAGSDVFISGVGDDSMADVDEVDGVDLYVFNLTNAGCGRDNILDFQDGVDKLKFTGIVDGMDDLTISSKNGWARISINDLDAETNYIAIKGAAGLIDANDFIFG